MVRAATDTRCRAARANWIDSGLMAKAGQDVGQPPAGESSPEAADGQVTHLEEADGDAGAPVAPPSPSSRATVAQRIGYLRQEKAVANVAGGPEAIERQHARGKL